MLEPYVMSRNHGHDLEFFLYGVYHIIYIMVKNANSVAIQP